MSKWRLTWTSTSAIKLAPKFTQGLLAWMRCEQPKSPLACVDAGRACAALASWRDSNVAEAGAGSQNIGLLGVKQGFLAWLGTAWRPRRPPDTQQDCRSPCNKPLSRRARQTQSMLRGSKGLNPFACRMARMIADWMFATGHTNAYRKALPAE